MPKTPSPALLALYEGVIAFDTWVEVDSGDERGVAAQCLDGTDCFFVAKTHPTYADCFGIADYAQASFRSLKQATLEACGWLESDWLPWCDYDYEGNLVAETDNSDRLKNWLNSPLGTSDWDFDLMGRWFDTTSIYAPGKAIEAALTVEERSDLGLAGVWMGSPGSSYLVYKAEADLKKLNTVMRAKALPYFFINEYKYLPDGI